MPASGAVIGLAYARPKVDVNLMKGMGQPGEYPPLPPGAKVRLATAASRG